MASLKSPPDMDVKAPDAENDCRRRRGRDVALLKVIAGVTHPGNLKILVAVVPRRIEMMLYPNDQTSDYD